MTFIYTLEDAARAPRPRSPLHEARIVLFSPSRAEVYSLDRQRLSFPNFTQEVTAPSTNAVARFMAEQFGFSLPPERYQLYHSLDSLSSGNQVSYFLGSLSSREHFPHRQTGVSIYAVQHQAVSASFEDRVCLQKLISGSSLC
ncbi:hypothetical protein HYT55_05920 [Candidatus Woesearchaeota archaeon]|nr:hypothetical protein [Candidatus Woesearchaeota archaeon]